MKLITPQPLKDQPKIGIVVSQFNLDITDALLHGALTYLETITHTDNITVIKVPGAVEIPVACKWLAESGNIDGVVALGAVIFGETDHYEHVCTAANKGCMDVMLTTGIPIGFGVLTVRELAQAKARSGGEKGNAGKEAAEAVVQMITLKLDISN